MTGDSPAPETPLYVVGDLHGRADLLSEMLDRIEADAGDSDATIVFLGDYVDRGADTRRVLDTLRDLQSAYPDRVICLMGNHERMMLDALDRPLERADRWLTHGGMETLSSYGMSDLFDPEEIATALRAALPDGMEAWLRDLPALIQSGDVVCVHAALDPTLPPEQQDTRMMLWGMPPRRARRDGLWVVHGHTVVDAPEIDARRLAIDTGAWFSGVLTAAVLHPGAEVRFLQTGT